MADQRLGDALGRVKEVGYGLQSFALRCVASLAWVRLPPACGVLVLTLLGIITGNVVQARTWKDATGKYTVEAEFVSLEDGKVSLQKPDGSVIVVPLERLSEADQRHVQSLSAPPGPGTDAAAKPEAKRNKAGAAGRAAGTGGAKPVKSGREAVELALSQRVAFSQTPIPLQDVVRQVTDQLQIAVCLDQRALDNIGVSTDAKVTARGRGETLEEFLNGGMKPLGLTWTIYMDLLVITSAEEAANQLETRVYKLVRPMDMDALVEDIGSKVAAETWNELGGPGSRRAWLGGAVVVTQTPVVHRQIAAQYGNVLQRAMSAEGKGAARGKSTLSAKLSLPVACEFVETPLQQVAAELSKQSGIALALDSQALGKAGADPNTPITLALRGASLESTLAWILRALGLTWIPDETGLRITTPEAAEAALHSAAYDVRDLVLASGGNASSLMDLITVSIAPASWRSVRGGPGNITLAGWDLQIQQIYQVHRQIERLLADLRQAMRS